MTVEKREGILRIVEALAPPFFVIASPRLTGAKGRAILVSIENGVDDSLLVPACKKTRTRKADSAIMEIVGDGSADGFETLIKFLSVHRFPNRAAFNI